LSETNRKRAAIKFCFWTVISIILAIYWVESYTSGQMIRWYYYTAKKDGFAVNANAFVGATKENPAILELGTFESIEGLQAVPVKKGDRLPTNANGIIEEKEIKEGKRVALEGNTLKVFVPSKIAEAKGFKYKDTFKHKGIATNPWSGVWNAFMVIAFGLALGSMAEGLTDIMGLKLKKIEHFGH
jgi:hypothetical protein